MADESTPMYLTPEVQQKSVKTLTEISGLGSGINNMISGLTTLIPMSENVSKAFTDANAAIKLFVGAAGLLKGVIALTSTLKRSFIATAVSAVAAKVAANPLMAAVTVGAIAGAVGGVAYFLNQTVYNDGQKEEPDNTPKDEYQEPTPDLTGGWWRK